MDTNIFLCGRTALEIWQLVRCLWKPHLDQLLPLSRALKQLHIGPARVERIGGCSPGPEQTRQRVVESLGQMCESLVRRPLRAAGRSIELSAIDVAPMVDAIVNGAPLELMVGDQTDRRNSGARRFHVFSGSIPEGFFVDLGGGVCVTAPQHVLSQMTSGLSLVELAMLAFELRGAYASDRFAKVAHAKRCLPLFDNEDLPGLLDAAAAFRKVGRARQALGLSLDRAASIAEAGMVMLACAPRRIGGYGLSRPEMNACLSIPEGLRGIVDWPWVACDAFWKDANTVLEYDGRDHQGRRAEGRDKRRSNVLSAMGLRTFTLDSEGFLDFRKFDQAVHQVAKSIGFRFDKRDFDKEWGSRCAALRTEVIGLVFGEQARNECVWM